MVDLEGTRGVIWEHEIYQDLEYNPDRAFFHSFSGDECYIGFVFASEVEARDFWKKVNSKKDGKKPKPKAEKKRSKPAKGGKIDKSMISGPKQGSFIHVAHMGYDADAGFTSRGVDPSWSAFLTKLESQGVGKEVIEREMEFIKAYVKNEQQQTQPKKPPPPPASRIPSDTFSAPQDKW
ncbi:hypothetical protein H1R20_g13307, partial [Candolleomyces eurysporus]